jgi:hypothetical protein
VAYRVVIPDEVGASMAGFSPELFGRIRRHLAGLAELAELLVPIDASWNRIASAGPPLFRVSSDGYRLAYQLEPLTRVLSLVDATPTAERECSPSFAPAVVRQA